jgi:signal transduction histidine kinase/AraC-like DNA-binding protein
MLTGETPPAQVLLPATLIVRQSCGCVAPSLADGAPESPPAVSLGRATHLAAIAAALAEDERAPELAELYDAFVGEVAGGAAGGFLVALDRVLRQTVGVSGDGLAWQRAISALRRQLIPTLLGDQRRLARAEDLLQRARVLVSEHAQRGHLYREWQTQQQSQRLRRINHVLATTTRVPDLMGLLAEELPQLGIARAYLALYEDPLKPTEWCRVVLAFDEDGRHDLGAEGRRVRTRDLVMGVIFPSAVTRPDWPIGRVEGCGSIGPSVDSGHRSPPVSASVLIQPLHFQDQQLGVVIFEQRSAGDIYEVLREEISVTLKAVMLSERNEALYRQAIAAEQVAQEGRWLAEEADRLKSRFLSMVSHELRTPLVLLVGLSEMMLRERTGDARPPLPAPYRQDLARIHVSAQQLDGLVRDVLDLTRSQMGQLRLMKEPLDLAPVLKAIALVGEQMARSKGLAWQADIPESLPKVSGDPARLRQVILNLITNAVKFTTHGQIVLGADAEADTLTVYVRDTGLGVPLAEQEAIFDEFRQSERTATRGYGGLGIGLAICRELVELHEGTIGVRSAGAEEGGSTFYFTLPTLAAAMPAVAAAETASQVVVLVTAQASRSGARLADYLAREGFLVEALDASADSGWLGRLLALTPGAVVLDCQPPSARGWQVIDTLKSNPATQDLPVLFYALAETDAGAMLALDHLPKPLGLTALAQALQRYGLAAEEDDDKRSILIVDDDPGIRELHAQVVRAALPDGWAISQAADGRMALDIMRGSPPALVLLDLMMPELDGMGVLAAMQEDERLRRIPVIVLTAQALTESEMAQFNRGVAAVLQKELFTADETLAHVVQALERNKRLGSEAQRAVRKAMAYIHAHYAEPISREDMAAHIGVSPRHLTRCFQQELALAPITYLNRYRVKRAKQLLARGEKNITEIAGAVGFSSSNYFTDAFRREAGMSPRDYQRRILAPKS